MSLYPTFYYTILDGMSAWRNQVCNVFEEDGIPDGDQLFITMFKKHLPNFFSQCFPDETDTTLKLGTTVFAGNNAVMGLFGNISALSQVYGIIDHKDFQKWYDEFKENLVFEFNKIIHENKMHRRMECSPDECSE